MLAPENIHSFILYLFFNPTFNRIIIDVLLSIQFCAFSNLFLICFLQFSFTKCSSNFIYFKITNNMNSSFSFFHRASVLTVIKTSSDQLGTQPFTKMFLYSNKITNFKIRTFFIIFFIKVIIYVWVYINGLRFNCAMLCIIIFISYII